MNGMRKVRLGVQGVDVCMRALLRLSKPAGFQDSEPGVGLEGFGAVTGVVAVAVFDRRLS